jgi:hypothetical protein
MSPGDIGIEGRRCTVTSAGGSTVYVNVTLGAPHDTNTWIRESNVSRIVAEAKASLSSNPSVFTIADCTRVDRRRAPCDISSPPEDGVVEGNCE